MLSATNAAVVSANRPQAVSRHKLRHCTQLVNRCCARGSLVAFATCTAALQQSLQQLALLRRMATTRLHVAGIPPNTSADDLRQLFAGVARVARVTIPPPRDPQLPRGYAFVEVKNAATQASRPTTTRRGGVAASSPSRGRGPISSGGASSSVTTRRRRWPSPPTPGPTGCGGAASSCGRRRRAARGNSAATCRRASLT